MITLRYPPIYNLQEGHLRVFGSHAPILVIRCNNRSFPFASALYFHNIRWNKFPQHLSEK